MYKPAQPRPYGGEKTEDLDAFITQLGVYMIFHSQSIVNDMQRIIAASQFLTGRAMGWFQPLLQDFIANAYKGTENLQQETAETFETYEHFIGKVRSMFGNPLKRQDAEKLLHDLRQTKRTSDYAVEFKRLAAEAQIPEASRYELFYRGCSKWVKDELARIDRDDYEFNEYVNYAIQTDQRSYQRYREEHRPKGARNGKSNRSKEDSKPLNAAIKDRPKKDRSNIKCFNCGKMGHFKSQCRSPKKEGGKQPKVPEGRPAGSVQPSDTTLGSLTLGSLNIVDKEDPLMTDNLNLEEAFHQVPITTDDSIQTTQEEEVHTVEEQAQIFLELMHTLVPTFPLLSEISDTSSEASSDTHITTEFPTYVPEEEIFSITYLDETYTLRQLLEAEAEFTENRY